MIAVAPSLASRALVVRRTRRLARAAIAWHLVELGVALGAGIAASSIALIGFGADSAIEALAGAVVLWRLASGSERRAQQLIAASFFVLAVYVGVESVRTLAGAGRPGESIPGIALAAVTAVTMPVLARAKRGLARRLGSHAAVSEAGQTMLCAYLSLALLAGLGLNAALGWWWADPAAALAIAAVAAREGVQSLRGEACCEVC